MKNILVSIDFDNNEKNLIEIAFQFAKPFGSKLWLIHIAQPDPEFIGYDVGPQYIRDFRASELREEHKLLQKYSKEITERGVESDGLLIQGATVEMVLEEAKKLKADLIVTGHHEHNFFYNAFVGSVSSEIVKKSKIPVLVVPLD